MSGQTANQNQLLQTYQLMMHFSERLKAARKMNGYSLQDLSDAIQHKINKQALNRMESGELEPDSTTISLLGKALKVPADYFFRQASVDLGDVRSVN